MKAYVRVWLANFRMELASEMAYRTNLLIKLGAVAILDLFTPLIALFIYRNSSGIPGWTLQEFILFTGTFSLIGGLSRFFLSGLAWTVIDAVRDGRFDRKLLMPFNTLKFVSVSGWDLNGAADVVVGLILVVWSAVQLDASFGLNVLVYLLLIALGIVFHYAVYVIIAAMAFLVVRSWSLFEIFDSMQKFARYPLNVYSGGLQIFLTFLIPVAVSAHYPTKALLFEMDVAMLWMAIPIALFLLFAIYLWNRAMKQYQSAGG